MIQLTIAHPTLLISSYLQPHLFYAFNGSSFHPSVYFPIPNTHHFMISSLKNSRLIFTPPCPTLVLACNIYTFFISSPSHQVPFFSIVYHYLFGHNSPHMHVTFFVHIWYSNAFTTFETNPYPRQQHFQVNSATSPQQKHIKILVRLLQTFFSIFPQDSMALQQARLKKI